MDERLPPEATHAVLAHADAILLNILHRCQEVEVFGFEMCLDAIDAFPINHVAVANLTLENCLVILETYADDFCIVPPSSIEGLRAWIQEKTSEVICHLGKDWARMICTSLQAFMEERSFDFRQISQENPLGHVSHRRERQEDDHVIVLEYRNVDDGLSADIWQYDLTSNISVYIIEQFKENSDVS